MLVLVAAFLLAPLRLVRAQSQATCPAYTYNAQGACTQSLAGFPSWTTCQPAVPSYCCPQNWECVGGGRGASAICVTTMGAVPANTASAGTTAGTAVIVGGPVPVATAQPAGNIVTQTVIVSSVQTYTDQYGSTQTTVVYHPVTTTYLGAPTVIDVGAYAEPADTCGPYTTNGHVMLGACDAIKYNDYMYDQRTGNGAQALLPGLLAVITVASSFTILLAWL